MAGAFDQLAQEIRWLRGEIPSSLLAPVGNRGPSPQLTRIAQQVEKLLRGKELKKFLVVLGRHNKDRRAPFLLAPHLFHVIRSVEERRAARARMPALDKPAAEVRDHLKEVSAKSKDLATRLRMGLQPRVVLAPRRRYWNALELMDGFSAIQSSSKRRNVMPLDQVLEDAAALLDKAAKKITRAKQHRRPSKSTRVAESEELRLRAASVLVHAFRDRLGHAYHGHVATIAELLSGITTDADFVKKVEKRGRAARAPGDKLPRKTVQTVS
jgi:hypothetical protein